MGRLLSLPRGLGWISYTRLSGPRTVGAGSSEGVTGWVQTVSSAFGLWRYSIGIKPINKRLGRLYRGCVTALHGGANAVRVMFCDPDMMTFQEAGVTASDADIAGGVPWGNGLPWSNGENWGVSRPPVAVAADAAQGATTISLEDQYWGHELVGGEWIGFFPFHFGKYEVTEVFDDGSIRIWPPLRKALVAGETCATLYPVMAMRLESEAAGTVQRGLVVSEGNTLTFVEVEDQDVRDFFAD